MRILFVSNYFPGELGPLARQLAAMPGNEVLFASNRQRKDFALDGVRRVRLKNYPALFGDAPPSVPRLWAEAVRRGGGGLHSLLALRDSWGVPDMVFASVAGGASLFATQAFPRAFCVAYAETGLKNLALVPDGVRQAWALLQSLLFLQSELCFAFSEWQKRLFPRQMRESILVVPPCVDAAVFSPQAARPWADDADGGAHGSLLTLDGLGLDSAELLALLRLGREVLVALPGCRVVFLAENGRLREAVETVAAAWPGNCRRRFAAYNSLPFERYRDLLAASSLVICAGGGEAAARIMLEVMSCERLLMVPAPRVGAVNFLRPGVNMLELPFDGSGAASGRMLSGRAALAAVLPVLAQCGRSGYTGELSAVARMARRNVLAHFDQAVVVPRHLALVMQAEAAWKKKQGRA